METAFQDGKEEILQAWYMDDSEEDQRLPHHREPKEFVSLDKLAELGIVSWRLNPDDYENDEDEKDSEPNYEEKLKNFFEEHLHTDEEIRYCLEGSGYFDVRDKDDHWIRIAVKKGGMDCLTCWNLLESIIVLHLTQTTTSRQCASLLVSQFGLRTIVLMIIFLLGKPMLRLLSQRKPVTRPLKLIKGKLNRVPGYYCWYYDSFEIIIGMQRKHGWSIKLKRKRPQVSRPIGGEDVGGVQPNGGEEPGGAEKPGGGRRRQSQTAGSLRGREAGCGGRRTLAYSSEKHNPLLPRLFAVVDDIFCLFQGHLENLASLKQQYWLGKTANEVIIVIEAYKTLRDRGPFPASQVLRDLSGKFAFILFDSSSNTTFIAADADGSVPFFRGVDTEDHLILSDDVNMVEKACGKSFAPFPKGCFFTTSGGLKSFEHPLNELKAVPRVDSQGQVCGAVYSVDDKVKKETGMPRVGSAADWSSQF